MGRAVIGYFRAAHPFPSFLVATVAAALGLIASGGEERGVAAMLGVGMLLYQFAIGTLNDVVDAEDDRRAKPSKPIASGAISRRGAAWLVVVYAGGGMALTAGLPNGGWFVGVVGLLMGVVYDLRLKRTALSWLPLSLALPMVPVWAFVSVGEWEDFLWFVFPLGAVLGFALQLANQAPDVETGGASGLGLPGLMGGRRARVVAVAAWVAGGVGVIAVLGVSGRMGGAVVAGGAGVCVVAGLPSVRRLGRDGLFGLLAVGTAIVALAFLASL